MNAPSDPQLDSLRIPPHSIEAEQSVIGGLLRDNAAYDRIADFMHAEDFYRYDHRIIFEQIVKMINGSRPADVITVFETLTQLGKAEDVGGLAYLNAMAQNTPSAANIRRYAEIVRDRGVLRKLITVADDISGTAFSPQGKEVRQMLDEAESKIFAIAEALTKQGFAVEKAQIRMPTGPLKVVGEHNVSVALHTDVVVEVVIAVVPDANA